MKTDFRIAQPDDVECTMTISMTLGSWRKLRDRLEGQSYPEFRLRQDISELISLAEAKFLPSKRSDRDVDP